MTKKVRLLIIVVAALLPLVLGACTGPAASEVATTPKAVTPAITAKAAWQEDWERTLGAARKEGKVVVYTGPIPSEMRAALTETFAKAYPGITAEFTGMTGAELPAKLKAEKGAGIHQVDLVISGTTALLTGTKPLSQPARPFLVLPEVKDAKVWLDGLSFADRDEINLVFVYNAPTSVEYNADLVDPKEITSFWDVAKPKWKGKIIIHDPTVTGPGNLTATMWRLSPELGLNYMKALAVNNPIFTRDYRLQVEWLAHGKYSIAVAAQESTVLEFMKAGAPIKFAPVMKEGSYATAASGCVAVLQDPPHPNALAVFLNWMLGKDGMTIWSRVGGYYVRRLDVNQEHINAALIPQPGAKYLKAYTEDIIPEVTETMKASRDIFGPLLGG